MWFDSGNHKGSNSKHGPTKFSDKGSKLKHGPKKLSDSECRSGLATFGSTIFLCNSEKYMTRAANRCTKILPRLLTESKEDKMGFVWNNKPFVASIAQKAKTLLMQHHPHLIEDINDAKRLIPPKFGITDTHFMGYALIGHLLETA